MIAPVGAIRDPEARARLDLPALAIPGGQLDGEVAFFIDDEAVGTLAVLVREPGVFDQLDSVGPPFFIDVLCDLDRTFRADTFAAYLLCGDIEDCLFSRLVDVLIRGDVHVELGLGDLYGRGAGHDAARFVGDIDFDGVMGVPARHRKLVVELAFAVLIRLEAPFHHQVPSVEARMKPLFLVVPGIFQAPPPGIVVVGLEDPVIHFPLDDRLAEVISRRHLEFGLVSRDEILCHGLHVDLVFRFFILLDPKGAGIVALFDPLIADPYLVGVPSEGGLLSKHIALLEAPPVVGLELVLLDLLARGIEKDHFDAEMGHVVPFPAGIALPHDALDAHVLFGPVDGPIGIEVAAPVPILAIMPVNGQEGGVIALIHLGVNGLVGDTLVHDIISEPFAVGLPLAYLPGGEQFHGGTAHRLSRLALRHVEEDFASRCFGDDPKTGNGNEGGMAQLIRLADDNVETAFQSAQLHRVVVVIAMAPLDFEIEFFDEVFRREPEAEGVDVGKAGVYFGWVHLEHLQVDASYPARRDIDGYFVPGVEGFPCRQPHVFPEDGRDPVACPPRDIRVGIAL